MRKILNNQKSLKRLGLKYCLKFLTVGFLGGSIIAIICVNQADPSWTNYNTVNSLVTNPLGWLGANLAATYFYLLGLVAYFVVILGVYLLWLNLAPKIKIQDEWERVLGFIGVLGSLLLIFKQGVLGRLIYLKLNLLFDNLVILLIGGIIFFAALTLILRFSLLLYFYHKITDLRAQVYYKKFISAGFDFTLNCLKAGFNLVKDLGIWIYRTIFGGILDSAENPELAATIFKAKYHDGATLEPDAQNLNTRSLNSLDLNSSNSNNFNFLNNFGLNKNATNSTGTTKLDHNFSANLSCDNSNNNSNNLGQAYKLPDLNIFTAMQEIYTQDEQVTKVLQKQAKTLAEKLKCFGVFGQVVSVEYGPVVSLFEFKPHIESKVSKIMALEHDLALALETTSLRIIAPVPGKSVVGFEVANRERRSVFFGDLIAAPEFKASNYELPLILGQDTIGKGVTIDLVKMPHLLIAGSTGAGKSVALNTMLTSLLCCCTPQNLKLILVDPKRLEFAGYEDIPHLLFPIATEAREVINILKWVVQEMEQRYLLMSETEVKNITEYHVYCEKNNLAHLPYLVVVIDELADLMMTAGKEVENLIIRIAQKARAAGIHLIVATQRPSVDVITG
ncbi:MAG TPA: DNA translocase FtsK 4TM domain-containing protein, partial [Candidatus Babeliales bacterium]|nr:DNA translocase FtsK 4TM domain-containing protein [Candidatus Babeliales bacterium]